MALGDKRNNQADEQKLPENGSNQSEPTEEKKLPDAAQVNPLEKFISSKPELERYSMTHAFKNFCIKNRPRFNEFKAESDFEKAFQEFYGK